MHLEYSLLISPNPQEAAGYIMRALRPSMQIVIDPFYNTANMVVIGVTCAQPGGGLSHTTYKINKGPALSPENGHIALTCESTAEFEAEKERFVRELGCKIEKEEMNAERSYVRYRGEGDLVNFHISVRKRPFTA